MATEKGHYKNVSNSHTLTEYIEKLFKYKPSKKTLELVYLQGYEEKGRIQLEAVKTAKNKWSLIVDNRQVGYKDIRKFATRVIGILSGTNLSSKSIETAKSINAKIQGIRLIKPKEDELEDEESLVNKKRSVSRQSYDSLYDNFSDLVNLLSLADGYDPIDGEFKIESLQAYLQNLLKLTLEMDSAVVGYAVARKERNEFMYTPKTGMVDIMLDAKKFIKGLYGATSIEFKTANKISFRNYKI